MSNLPWQRLDKPIGRNAPCPCKSGKKWKHCCLPRVNGTAEIAARRAAIERTPEVPEDSTETAKGPE